MLDFSPLKKLYIYIYIYVRPQALEDEKAALRSQLEEKYASASEGLAALSLEKREAQEACSRLREEALKLEERAVTVTNELQVTPTLFFL